MRILLLSLCLLSGALLAGQEQITAVEYEYLSTWSTNDADAANGILHTDYFYVGADGERHGREWTVSMIDSGRLVYEHVTIERGPVHDLGDVVVSLGTLRASGSWDGKPMVDHLAYTMVWARTDGRMKLLS